MEQITDRRERAQAALAKALEARETPFRIATVVTAAWRHAIGDDVGAMYGLVEHGYVLWKLIEQVVEFEREREANDDGVSRTLASQEELIHRLRSGLEWIINNVDHQKAPLAVGRAKAALHG